MRADDPNLPYLCHIAEALGDLLEQVVFVSGAVAGLLVTDPLADPVRSIRDVDGVVDESRAMFHRIDEAMAARGLPPGRWQDSYAGGPPSASEFRGMGDVCLPGTSPKAGFRDYQH